MKFNLTSIHWKLIIASLLGVSTLAYCAPADWFGLRKPDFELTGQVLDFDTKQPIEGAYVLAVYQNISSAWFVGSSLYCVKTKGMYSDKDGYFHFPVEKLDRMSPGHVYAIKPDYFLQTQAQVPDNDFKVQNRAAYSSRHVYLKKQDPAKPEFLYRFDYCSRPESIEAIQAALTYMDMTVKEETKYGKDIRSVNSTRSLMKSMQESAEKQIYKK